MKRAVEFTKTKRSEETNANITISRILSHNLLHFDAKEHWLTLWKLCIHYAMICIGSVMDPRQLGWRLVESQVRRENVFVIYTYRKDFVIGQLEFSTVVNPCVLNVPSNGGCFLHEAWRTIVLLTAQYAGKNGSKTRKLMPIG